MFSDQDVSDFLDTLEYDLINLCEDNEEMKKAIREYLKKCRAEHNFGTDMD